MWILVLALAIAAGHAAPALNQKTSQELAEKLNREASDKSMQNATVKAMQALMDLSAAKIPSAIDNGYQAYGKFRNSEHLDDMGYENLRLKASMSSAGKGAALPPFESTSFRRLDPAFLRSGEAGRVAAEFERQSGMKRERFLQMLSSVSEKKIDPKDPQMVDKVLTRFEAFLDEIPNRGFKAKLEKSVNSVPQSLRRGMIGKTVAKFVELASDVSSAFSGGSVAPDGATAKPTPASATNWETKERAGYQAVTGLEPTRRDGLAELGAITAAQGGGVRNVPVEGIVGDAIATSLENETIFQQVTRRYRALIPNLVTRGETAR